MLLSHRVRTGLARTLALVLLLLIASQSASAADKVGGSLEFVPADASFYTASLRLKEQFDIVRQSKAWKKVQEIPAVQLGWQLVQAQLAQPNSPLDIAQQMLELPENQQLVELLGDMVSTEIFVYGDPSVTRLLTVVAESGGDAQATNMINSLQDALDLNDDDDDDDTPEESATERQAANSRESRRAFLGALSAHLDDLIVPNVVVGFKLSKTEPAVTQLKRLEVLTKMALKQAPQLVNRLKRTKIGETDYLTLALDGSLIPWEQIPWEKLEDEPGEFARLQKKLKSLTLSVTLGVRGQYLLASLGSSNDHLAKLGQGALLVDRPELKPLAPFAAKRLTGVAFVSGDLRSAAGTTKKDVEKLTTSAAELLKQLELDKPLEKRILTDVKSFIADVKRYVPDIGSAMAFSFLTDRGVEGYAYDWSENLFVDASQPLTLVDHVGGDPLAALVVRGKYDPGQWDLLVKWTQIGYGYFQEFGLPQLEPDQRAAFDKGADIALPLLGRFANATRDLLLPSLSDGQSALVIEAKISSRQWHKEMPKAAKPLPMIEPALVLGVSDAKWLKQAVTEYLAIANKAIVEIRNANPQAIPADFQLPPPEKSESKLGESYAYPLPAEAGLDPRLVFNAGLSKNLAVFTIVRDQTQALLEQKPLELPKALGDTKRPLAAVAWFNWVALVEAVMPWVDYAVSAGGRQTTEDGEDEADVNPQNQFILDQVHAVVNVMKVLRSYASVTYAEGKALVVHSELHFRDLD
jgi:hypothetical protein